MKKGRPLNAELDQAIFQSAEEILADEGLEGLTVERLVRRADTSRPTFYRRYRSIEYLIFDVVAARFRPHVHELTGSLREDLVKVQKEEVTMFSDIVLQNCLTGLFELIRTNQEIRRKYVDDFILPRRARVRLIIDDAAERGEIVSADVDFDWVCNLLMGPILGEVLVPAVRTSHQLSPYLVERTVDLAIDAINATAVAPASAG